MVCFAHRYRLCTHSCLYSVVRANIGNISQLAIFTLKTYFQLAIFTFCHDGFYRELRGCSTSQDQQILDWDSLSGRSILHDIIPVRDCGCISSRLKGTLVKFSCMDQAKMKDNWSSPSRWLPVDFPLTSHWLINEIPVQVYWDSLLSPSHCTKNWSLSSSSPIACNGGGRLTILSFLL